MADPFEAVDALSALADATRRNAYGYVSAQGRPVGRDEVAGALGTERPLGQGSVGMPRFIAKLKEIGYKGTLNVEREVPDHSQRLADIKMGVGLLRSLGAAQTAARPALF